MSETDLIQQEISEMGIPPSRERAATLEGDSDRFFGELSKMPAEYNALRTQINAAGAWINQKQAEITTTQSQINESVGQAGSAATTAGQHKAAAAESLQLTIEAQDVVNSVRDAVEALAATVGAAAGLPALAGNGGKSLKARADELGVEFQDDEPGLRKLTALGAITAGDIVALNADGTVEAIVDEADSIGAQQATPFATNALVDIVWVPTEGSYVVLAGANIYIATISAGIVTFTYQAPPVGNVPQALTYDPVNDVVVVIGRSTNYVATAGTLSGTTISWGSNRTLSVTANHGTSSVSAVYVPELNAVAYAGASGESGAVYLGIVTISGTAVANNGGTFIISGYGTTTAALNPKLVWDAESSAFYCVADLVTPNEICVGSTVVNHDIHGYHFHSANIPDAFYSPVSGDTAAARTLIADDICKQIHMITQKEILFFSKGALMRHTATGFINTTTPNYRMGDVLRVSDYLVNIWAPTSTDYPTYTKGLVLSETQNTLINEVDSVIDTFAVHNSPFTFINGTNGTDEILSIYRDSTGTCVCRLLTMGKRNHARAYGIAKESASDGQPLNIHTKDGVWQTTGLTLQSDYYVGKDGTLSTDMSTGPKIGRALSSTELLITREIVQ